jgi:phospholipid transport system substrate-binding protein
MPMKSVCGRYGAGNLNRLFVVFMSLVSVFCLAGSEAAAVAVDPMTQLKEEVDGVIQILRDEQLAVPEMREARRQKVEVQVDKMFDFQEMGRKSLGGVWDKATPEEKKEFTALFAKLVKERYIGKIDSYSGQEVVFKKQRIQENFAVVYSSLLDNGREVPIDYKLLTEGGRWLAYDLIIENVSLVANYRRDFAGIIKQNGFSGLLAKMKEKIDKFDAGVQ